MTPATEGDTRSRLVLFFQNDATPANSKPSMKGTAALG